MSCHVHPWARPRSRLNRARLKAGKPPILSWHDVHIRIDDGRHSLASTNPGTMQRALYHVRTHFRLRLGKVEVVRPHWRGNPEKGMIRHRYITLRAEDEPGPWAGGPLPGPQIIQEMYPQDESATDE